MLSCRLYYIIVCIFVVGMRPLLYIISARHIWHSRSLLHKIIRFESIMKESVYQHVPNTFLLKVRFKDHHTKPTGQCSLTYSTKQPNQPIRSRIFCRISYFECPKANCPSCCYSYFMSWCISNDVRQMFSVLESRQQQTKLTRRDNSYSCYNQSQNGGYHNQRDDNPLPILIIFIRSDQFLKLQSAQHLLGTVHM